MKTTVTLPPKTKKFQDHAGAQSEWYKLDYYDTYTSGDSAKFGKILAKTNGLAELRKNQGYLTKRFNKNPSSRYSQYSYPGYIALYIRGEEGKK